MANRVWTKLVGIAAVVTALQLPLFYHYNRLLGTSANAVDNITVSPAQQQAEQKEISDLKRQYKFVTVSSDGQYAAYLDSKNVLHVVDLATHQEVCAANNPYTVQYVAWIEDERLFVGEQVQPGDLELKTVDVPSGVQTIVTRFEGLPADASFTKITFSTYTNDIYILINSGASSSLYHIGTMSNVSLVPVGGRYIKNIAITQTGSKLYFEDYADGSFNVLSLNDQGTIRLIKRDAALVAVVGNTLYYGGINGQGLVTAVYRYDASTGASTLVKTLASPTLAADIEITDNGSVQVNAPT
ncbi:hypothetical protein [Alicyclobacillus vulcanalis]|uniref:DUF5050 domain-containing protein n=1 Tax=Alicyclobacillus vulcanalis TaxID=252246 RepID=A0A1N7NZM9_9BACL|nr:hypothetical protein [Alicyclobacillus vulcanalis]SIT03782.1 hypothetical protein SAMN05421799_110105 [Alicyclobacillus vulcanalis]